MIRQMKQVIVKVFFVERGLTIHGWNSPMPFACLNYAEIERSIIPTNPEACC